MCALTLCSLLLYALVMAIIPRRYATLSNARVEQDVMQLAGEIDGMDYAPASQALSSFCMENHVTAMLMAADQTLLFGGESEMEETEYTASISVALRLRDIAGSSVLTVISSGSTARQIMGTFLDLLPFAAAVIVLISSLSAWLCSGMIVKPVLQISSVSKRMAQMDMTWHCETGRSDELGTLADSLNTLAARLTQAMGALEAANARLREDIAASRTLEKQRRDFFAAASHELKTPLTVLKGQIESMSLGIGDYKNHEKYLPQALAAVEGMERLICEILAITKMESGIPASAFTEETLAPILRACAAEHAPLAEEKQIVIDTRQIKDTVSVRVSKPLFQKAISNIVSNAVRYSPEGQRVSVILTEERLTVENTGVTIAQEDLPSLFAPFYRADRSRSRKSGGSGLGLYLVKTILDLHGFAAQIENAGSAVRFTIFLNQNEME